MDAFNIDGINDRNESAEDNENEYHQPMDMFLFSFFLSFFFLNSD